jgi:hypothetical protein
LFYCAGTTYTGAGLITADTCAQGIDDTAFPAVFQAPFYIAWQNAVTAAIQHMMTASYASKIAYVRVGGALGGDWVPIAPKGLETLPGVSSSTLQTVWVNYMSTIESTIVAQKSPFRFDQATNGGATAAGVQYSFADAEATLGAGNGFGIGTEGFQNNDIAVFLSVGTADGGGGTTGYSANDWLYTFSHNKAAFYQVQTGGQSDPTFVGIPQQQTMGSLVTLLPFGLSQGVTDFEVYYQDWQVAYDSTSTNYAAYHPAYQQAIQGVRKAGQ